MNKRLAKKQGRKLVKDIRKMSFKKGEVLAIQLTEATNAKVMRHFFEQVQDTVGVPVVVFPPNCKVSKIAIEEEIGENGEV